MLHLSALFAGAIGQPPLIDSFLESGGYSTNMPYIVPSTSSSTTSSTITPPHSPSRPPLALSIALASPAPVPAPTPFKPSEISTSPRSNSCFGSGHHCFGSADVEMSSRGLVQQHLPLIKALSDTGTRTSATLTGPSDDKGSSPPSHSPPMRRSVSASSASSMPTVLQHSNTAGSSLPHVPRRRTGNSFSLMEDLSSPPRGRSRSRFLLGNEEESGSSGSEGRRRGVAKVNTGIVEGSGIMEERVARKRPVSAERSSLKFTSSLLPLSPATRRPGPSDSSASDSEASDCMTPTQNRISQGMHKLENTKNSKNKENGQSTFAGIAPRARRGRHKDYERRLAFGSDSEDEVGQSKKETSTISFPTSSPPSPPPCIAVNTPTPEMSPFTSPHQDGSPKSFAGKRANAESLRLDFSFGARSGESDDTTFGRSKHPIEHGRTLSESASLNSMPLIRKKSGEVVRPSLKTRSSSASSARQRPSFSLGDISSLAMNSPSISAPATPSTPAKMVHFDAQLEHVRVFKSSSRPVAVSRDGSPTYDDTTSGGEGDSASEGPSLADFVPRPRPRRLVPGGTAGEEEEAVRRVLMMRVLNMPKRDLSMDDADVRLEGLHLAGDAASVQGIVRVRNIAFEKTVAVRFTFDGWQTTSEVLARWSESCVPRNIVTPSAPRIRAVSTPVPGSKTDEASVPTFDRFTFSIRLADLLLRIDEKTLVLAIRYCSAGREIWDNNDGQNYRVVFERRPQHSLTLSGPAVVPPGPDESKEKRKGADANNRPGGAGAAPSNSGTSSGDKSGSLNLSAYMSSDKVPANAVSKLKDARPTSSAKKISDLSSRYDIDSSLKNPSTWKPTFEQLRTWAGPNTHDDTKATRPKIPWSTNVSYNREPSRKFVAEFFKTRPFESHNVSFSSRDIARGSPRDLDRESLDDSDVERYSRARCAISNEASTPMGTPLSRFPGGSTTFVSPSSWAHSGQEHHVRNHHRSSYFDGWVSPGYSASHFGTGKARLTPPGTPGSLAVSSLSGPDMDPLQLDSASHPPSHSSREQSHPSPGRRNSFPPLLTAVNGAVGAGLGLMTSDPLTGRLHNLDQLPSDSEASTPSIASVSSPTMTASPSSPPEFPSMAPLVHVNWIAPPDGALLDTNNYKAFVNSFCFYQGRLEIPESEMRRAHSASEVQELLSTPPPSSAEVYPLFKGPAPVSSGLGSCTTTPTASPGSLSPGAMPEPPTSAGLLETETGLSTQVRC
ncbi:hypothetical protein ACEPAI_5540 [Sanghuangporus weigelae]